MLNNLEHKHQEIATAINELIEDDWSTAIVEAIFFQDSTTFLAEYVRASDGRSRSFETNTQIEQAFEAIRDGVRQSGQPVWGRARFEINSHGKFAMHFEYDSCDAFGNYQMDDDEYSRYMAERFKRLTSN